VLSAESNETGDIRVRLSVEILTERGRVLLLRLVGGDGVAQPLAGSPQSYCDLVTPAGLGLEYTSTAVARQSLILRGGTKTGQRVWGDSYTKGKTATAQRGFLGPAFLLNDTNLRAFGTFTRLQSYSPLPPSELSS